MIRSFAKERPLLAFISSAFLFVGISIWVQTTPYLHTAQQVASLAARTQELVDQNALLQQRLARETTAQRQVHLGDLTAPLSALQGRFFTWLPTLLRLEQTRLSPPLNCSVGSIPPTSAVPASLVAGGSALNCSLALSGRYSSLLDTVRRLSLAAPVLVAVTSVTMTPHSPGSYSAHPQIDATVNVSIIQIPSEVAQ